MKQYPKSYEDFLTSDRSLKHLKISKVGVDAEMDAAEYREKLSNTFWDFQLTTFDFIIQLVWLLRKFKYEDKIKGKNAYGTRFNRAFGVFMRQHVGFNIRLFTYSLEHSIIKKYIDDFFPNFMEKDPFKDELKYPYRYMNLECLALVMNLDDKLDLLAYGDEHKMGYNEFVDYVINHVNCYNDEVGYDHYRFGELWASHLWSVKINKDKKDKYEHKT